MSQLEAGTMLAITDFISAYKRDLNRRLALIQRLERLLEAVGQPAEQAAHADHRQNAARRQPATPTPRRQPQAIWSQWPTASEARQPHPPPQANQS